MKIGLVSDIHGNPDGLKKCLTFMVHKGVDQFLFLGDMVGYLPDVKPALDMLIEHHVECVLGNHDAMLLNRLPLDHEKDKIYRLSDTRSSLTDIIIAEIRTWLP